MKKLSARHFIICYVTCGTKKEAQKISTHLLNQKLIACANILTGMKSHYIWKNKIEKSREVVLILKTKKNLFKKIEAEILKLHSYSCPCIVALPLIAGNRSYLKWLHSSLK